MSRIICYIATSVDGFISDAEGGVEWLSAYDNSGEDYNYSRFFSGVDALLMGRNTYNQVLGFGDWPYKGKPSYVFTHNTPDVDQPADFLSGDLEDCMRELRKTHKGDLWLVGGGELIKEFRKRSLIDLYIITILPLLLGKGTPLFHPVDFSEKMRLTKHQSFDSGIIQIWYERMSEG